MLSIQRGHWTKRNCDVFEKSTGVGNTPTGHDKRKRKHEMNPDDLDGTWEVMAVLLVVLIVIRIWIGLRNSK